MLYSIYIYIKTQNAGFSAHAEVVSKLKENQDAEKDGLLNLSHQSEAQHYSLSPSNFAICSKDFILCAATSNAAAGRPRSMRSTTRHQCCISHHRSHLTLKVLSVVLAGHWWQAPFAAGGEEPLGCHQALPHVLDHSA